MDGGDGDLARLIGRAALDGRGDDLAGGLVGLGTDGLLGLTEDLGLLAHALAADALDELAMRIVLGETSDALEFHGLLGDHVIKVTLALVKLTLEAGELVLTAVELVVAPIKGLLALHDAVLEVLKLDLALLLFCLGVLLELKNLLLRLEDGLLLGGLRQTLGLRRDAVRLALGIFELGISGLETRVAHSRHDDVSDDCTHHEADDANDEFHNVLLK